MRLREHQDGLPALEDNKRRAEEERETLQGPIRGKRHEIEQAELRLNALMRDRGQQQNAYPPSMPRLISAICQDSGFQQTPVGPVGNHVQLLKPLWSSVLEKSFGGTLDSFIVTSKEDQLRLSALMQRVKW